MNCLRYVSLNMVRAGVVEHPSQWRWSGHDELVGRRFRYRLLDMDRLLESLAMARVSDFSTVYEQGIDTLLQRRQWERIPEWTESLAVGDRVFVERVARNFERRSKFDYSETADRTGGWSVRESRRAYNLISTPK